MALVLVVSNSYKGLPKWIHVSAARIVWAAQEMLPAAPHSLSLINAVLKVLQIWRHIDANVLRRNIVFSDIAKLPKCQLT